MHFIAADDPRMFKFGMGLTLRNPGNGLLWDETVKVRRMLSAFYPRMFKFGMGLTLKNLGNAMLLE